MPAQEDDFDINDLGPKRDGKNGWGRPMLLPIGSTVRAPYTRASSLADYIEKDYGIRKWDIRNIVRGLGEREDLAACAGAIVDYDKPSGKHELDLIADRAREQARSHSKADWGTAVHGYTDPGARRPPARMVPDVDSYLEATRDFETVATSVFIANDALMAAGTFDHIYRHLAWDDDRIVDKKTGRYDPFSWVVQTAVYAYGEPYDPNTNTRPGWGGGRPPSQSEAIIAWIPRGEGRTVLFALDLEAGWDMAQHAAAVRDGMARKDLCGELDVVGLHHAAQEKLAGLVALAGSADEVKLLWQQHRCHWDENLTKVAKARLDSIPTIN